MNKSAETARKLNLTEERLFCNYERQTVSVVGYFCLPELKCYEAVLNYLKIRITSFTVYRLFYISIGSGICDVIKSDWTLLLLLNPVLRWVHRSHLVLPSITILSERRKILLAIDFIPQAASSAGRSSSVCKWQDQLT